MKANSFMNSENEIMRSLLLDGDRNLKAFYEDYWRFRQKMGYIYSEKSFPRRFPIVLSLAGSGKKILDVGCGEGYLSKLLMEQDNEVIGIDISENAVKLAQKNGVNAYLCDVEKEDLPFNDKSFNLIILSEVLEHVIQPEKVLEKLKHYVKDKGSFIITFPNIAFYKYRLELLRGRFPKQYLYDTSEHLHHWTIPDFIDFLRSCNFRVKDIIPVYSFPFLHVVFKLKLRLIMKLFKRFANILGYQIVVLASPN